MVVAEGKSFKKGSGGIIKSNNCGKVIDDDKNALKASQIVVEKTIPQQILGKQKKNGQVLVKNSSLPAKCEGCGRETDTSLSCPKCVELRIHPNYFCSQDCFRSNWAVHKELHSAMQSLIESQNRITDLDLKTYDPNDRVKWLEDRNLCKFVKYKFTGNLRPWPVSTQRSVPSHLSVPDYAFTGFPATERANKHRTSVHVHSKEEIGRLREACLLGRQALDLANSLIKPGVTCEDIDVAVHNFIVDKGGYPSPLNYDGFPKSCCTSVNEVICHGIPDFRSLQNGDIVNVDVTVFYKGMHGDLNETFFVGEVSDDNKRLVQGAYLCLMEAIKYCRPGVMYREIGRIVSDVAEKHGLSVVRSYCGHGIGELFHTAPNVPHYRKNKAIGVMKPGHVFTIEPMINLGVHGSCLWPDGWTAVTVDGKSSAQFEHTLLITENGLDVLTSRLPLSPKLTIDTHGHDFP